MSSIQLLAPNHSLEQRVNDYMKPFHTATCQEHLIGALHQLPRSSTFPREESSIREQVALRLLQEVIVMGAEEQEALDACLVTCGPLEALSACATTLQEIASRNKPKKKKKKAQVPSSVESPSILETALRTIRRWLVKGVSFPPVYDSSNSYEDRCWVEKVTVALALPSPQGNNNNNHQSSKANNADSNSPLVQACFESITKLVLMLPVQISNACHALSLQLPTWAISSRYNPRIIEGALSMALYQQEIGESSYSASYFKLLVQHMVRSRNPDDVALGLYKFHERHYRNDKHRNEYPSQPKALCHLLLQLHRSTLSPRESAHLLRSIMISSIPRQSHATKIATAQLTELWQRHLFPYMELSCRPILVASRRVREAFVRLLVLSPTSVLSEEWPDRLLCHCVASLLANPVPLVSEKTDKTLSAAGANDNWSESSSESSSDATTSDSDSGSSDDGSTANPQNVALQHHAWLAKHVQEVIATWSLAVFVRQTDYQLQRHVTNFLLSGMCFLQLQHTELAGLGGTGASKGGPPMSELVSGLLEGVTVRLESSIPAIRKDGMMIAERLAQKMGQELQFEELDQERSMMEDDEVTFLQSVMTASEFPSHYCGRVVDNTMPDTAHLAKPPRTHQQAPPLLEQRRDQQSLLLKQQQQQQQQAERPNYHCKKKGRKKEKEERRKRRQAKREGKSETRILDAVFGNNIVTSSTYRPSESRTVHQPPCDSYEDSYSEGYGVDIGIDSHLQPEPTRPPQHYPLYSQLHYQGKGQHSVPSDPRMASRRQANPYRNDYRIQGKPNEHSRNTTDSYDNSTSQEMEGGEPELLRSNAPLHMLQQRVSSRQEAFEKPGHGQRMQSHYYDSHQQQAFHDEHVQHHQLPPQTEVQMQPQSTMHGHNQVRFSSEQRHHHQRGFHDEYVQQNQILPHAEVQMMQPQISIHGDSDVRYSGPKQHLPPEYTAPQLIDMGHREHEQLQHPTGFNGADQISSFYHEKEQFVQTPPYVTQPEVYYIDQNAGDHEGKSGNQVAWDNRQVDNGQHVTWDNREYVIPEPKDVQQDFYWQTQKKQQRRQQHYKQQQAVELQLRRQHQQHQKHKQQERELEQKATVGIAAKVSSNQETPLPPGNQETQFQQPAVNEMDDNEDDSKEADLVENANEDDNGVAACWTHKEVEMVLENDPPQHSQLSPLPRSPSPRHTKSPAKSPERITKPVQAGSPRHVPDTENKSRDTPSSQSDRGGDVPSLIFAMVEDENECEREEVQEMGGKYDDDNAGNDGRDLTGEMDTEGKQNDRVIPNGKPPLSPRSQGHYHYNYRKKKKQPSLSSSETPNNRDSLTSVRSRKHPQVDPEEIDARILAAAYDHESVASTNSAPSLSVYSSSSSDFSLSLNGDQARTEASHRATRPPKRASPNAYEHMRNKYQQASNPRHRSPIILDGRTPNAPNKRVLGALVDPDAIYNSDEEDDYDDDDDEYYDDDYDENSGTSDDEVSYTDGNSYTEEDEYDEEDSVWEESGHLNAYDVEDDEEDIRETKRPRYLRDCLALLRAQDSDKSSRSKHESALKWLPRILQHKEKPTDLPDLAVPLALELMRMENKFNLENFEDDKLVSVISLTVQEPLAVGQRLILLLWEDIAFMDRLDVLTVLSEAAFDLSGNKELEQWQKAAVSQA